MTAPQSVTRMIVTASASWIVPSPSHTDLEGLIVDTNSAGLIDKADG